MTTDFARRSDYANAVVVQSDGKLLAGGHATYSRTNGRNRLAVARYNVDGTLDTTFSGDGKQTTNFTRRNDPVMNLGLQPDGKVVAAGISTSDGSHLNVALARWNARREPQRRWVSDDGLHPAARRRLLLEATMDENTISWSNLPCRAGRRTRNSPRRET